VANATGSTWKNAIPAPSELRSALQTRSHLARLRGRFTLPHIEVKYGTYIELSVFHIKEVEQVSLTLQRGYMSCF
jgi:hypothetical protein